MLGLITLADALAALFLFHPFIVQFETQHMERAVEVTFLQYRLALEDYSHEQNQRDYQFLHFWGLESLLFRGKDTYSVCEKQEKEGKNDGLLVFSFDSLGRLMIIAYLCHRIKRILETECIKSVSNGKENNTEQMDRYHPHMDRYYPHSIRIAGNLVDLSAKLASKRPGI